MENVATLERISNDRLAELILAQEPASGQQSEAHEGLSKVESSATADVSSSSAPSVAIIDVRDQDHIGGHIHSSTHVPSTTLSAQLPTLLRTLEDKDVVVFHCALSQQRGPGAALAYLREKRFREEGKAEVVGQDEGSGRKEAEQEKPKKQEVLVLEGGFVKWAEKYGEDSRLTDAFAKDIWQEDY
ncbi:MAG: hypothetical protein M1817_006198 [Caeruleum heppii]|nr:MAG: hypothetical protein M1817_006198 [Caeruleum heppii]